MAGRSNSEELGRNTDPMLQASIRKGTSNSNRPIDSLYNVAYAPYININVAPQNRGCTCTFFRHWMILHGRESLKIDPVNIIADSMFLNYFGTIHMLL